MMHPPFSSGFQNTERLQTDRNSKSINAYYLGLPIGFLFLASGVLKAFDTMAFARNISAYGFPYADSAAITIIGLEVSIGLCWLLGIRPKANAVLTMAVTALLTAVFIYGLQAKGIEDCGCMGEFVKIPVSLSLLRNALLIALAYAVWKSSLPIKITRSWKIVALVGLSCTGTGLAGLSAGKTLFNHHQIKPGQRIEETVFASFKDKLAGPKSFVFVFSPACPHCWNASENVKNLKATPEFAQLIGVVAAGSDATDYIEEVRPNFEIFEDPTNQLANTFKGVPVLVGFENGKVSQLYTSDHIPSGAYLKHYQHN